MTSGLDNARLRVVVHEVRSPVAALSALAETIGESGSDAAARRQLVRLAVAACRSIERLVLDLAVTSVRLEAMDVAALVRDVVASHVVRGADVVERVDEEPLVVDADPVRLRQALDNLVVNALTHGGGKTVAVRAARSGSAVRIDVSDEGAGISASELDSIFEIGVRLADATPGSGVGLALARAIVTAHGGTLDVVSAPGQGSTFTIALPARSAQPETTASSS